MGFWSKTLDILGYSDAAGFSRSGITAGGLAFPMASPFGSGYVLDPVIASDLGLPYGASVSALEAYKVPAVSRAMALLTGTAANCEFVAKDPDKTAPAWLNETAGAITPGMRLGALVADLVLYREGCWFVTRDGAGAIASALHLPRDVWQLDGYGKIWVGGVEVPPQNVLYFQSLRPLGLLTAAADTITSYHDIVRTILSRGKNPIPLVELHVTEDYNPTDKKELERVQENWSKARTAKNGAVAITPHGVTVETHMDTGDATALAKARNEARLDVANFTNLPAAMLEGNSGASGTYENTLQTKDEFIFFSMAEVLAPIEQRLSQSDACGTKVKLDLSAYTATGDAAGNTGAATAVTGTAAGTAPDPAASTAGAIAAPVAAAADLSTDDLVKLTNAAAALIRSGYDPAATLTALGLPTIDHLGLLPVTVQKPADPDGTPDEDLVNNLTEGDTPA